jgi:hypothetical protein
MHRQAVFALTHPVFDPERQIGGHHWSIGRISAGLTVNIGME